MSINGKTVIICGVAAIAGLCKIFYEKGRYDAIHSIYKNGMTVVQVDERNDKEEGLE